MVHDRCAGRERSSLKFPDAAWVKKCLRDPSTAFSSRSDAPSMRSGFGWRLERRQGASTSTRSGWGRRGLWHLWSSLVPFRMTRRGGIAFFTLEMTGGRGQILFPAPDQERLQAVQHLGGRSGYRVHAGRMVSISVVAIGEEKHRKMRVDDSECLRNRPSGG